MLPKAGTAGSRNGLLRLPRFERPPLPFPVLYDHSEVVWREIQFWIAP